MFRARCLRRHAGRAGPVLPPHATLHLVVLLLIFVYLLLLLLFVLVPANIEAVDTTALHRRTGLPLTQTLPPTLTLHLPSTFHRIFITDPPSSSSSHTHAFLCHRHESSRLVSSRTMHACMHRSHPTCSPTPCASSGCPSEEAITSATAAVADNHHHRVWG